MKGGDAAYNAVLTRRLLQGEELPQRGIVLLNAAAAIAAGTEDQSIAGLSAGGSRVPGDWPRLDET